MTTKDYVLIARHLNAEIRSWRPEDVAYNRSGFARMLNALSAAFELDNPKFDKQKFLNAVMKGVDDD